jgi:hypothetical protein
MLAFTLMLRLPDGYEPPRDAGRWADWRDAASLVPQAEYGDPHDEPPFKRYPGTREYFSAPAQETLFPERDLSGRSGRWLRRPQDWSVALVPDGAGETELGVDLLEIVRVRLAPQVSFGIAHLSVDADLDADRMLATSRALATRYRPADRDTPRLVVFDGAERRQLAGSQPLHRLTAALFGDAHEFVAPRAYIFAAAQVPAEVDTVQLAAWRRALGQGYGLARAAEAYERDPERDRRRTERFGPTEATFFGRSAALTFRDEPSVSLRNIRSYWSETVLLGLIQHAYVEHYAARLSELGGLPLSSQVEGLYGEWLAFRNVLWWQHASFTTDVANRLLRHTHNGLDTRALYGELERSFSTYVEVRRHRAQEVESRALRALQVYGAAFAAVGSAAAIMQVAGEEYLDALAAQVAAVLSLVALGMLAAWLAARTLSRRHTGSSSHPDRAT